MNDFLEKPVLIAAHARSGSTYLCQVLEQLEKTKVYLEIFHFSLSQISIYLGEDYEHISKKLELAADDSGGRRQIVEDPIAYLRILQEINSDKRVAFKVFPKHLSNTKLGDVVASSGVVIILSRNLLHSYISNLIATKLKRWSSYDTSQEKVIFSSDEFLKHVREVFSFYKEVEKYASDENIKTVYIDYEDLSSSDDPIDVVQRALDGFCGGSDRISCREVSIVKQDRRVSACEKISNVSEMTDFLGEFDLLKLIDGTSSIILDDYYVLPL